VRESDADEPSNDPVREAVRPDDQRDGPDEERDRREPTWRAKSDDDRRNAEGGRREEDEETDAERNAEPDASLEREAVDRRDPLTVTVDDRPIAPRGTNDAPESGSLQLAAFRDRSLGCVERVLDAFSVHLVAPVRG
jgi:hypothetical protein